MSINNIDQNFQGEKKSLSADLIKMYMQKVCVIGANSLGATNSATIEPIEDSKIQGMYSKIANLIQARIFSKKQDSLHKLSSLMIPIDLYDDIEIEESISENIKFSDGNLNNIESTIHKALKLIRKNNPSFDKSFDIYIDKKIPYNSGLGGGSSDAGALIRYLCDNYELDLPSNLEIVREVGSDVPFFVQGVSAVIKGIGEIVEPLDLNLSLIHI